MGNSTEKAILAGGCFWGMQDLFRRFPGVISTRVGYTGGEVANATYRNHEGMRKPSKSSLTPISRLIAKSLNFSSRFTIQRRPTVRETIMAQAIGQLSSTPAKHRTDR